MLYAGGVGLPPREIGDAARIESVVVPRWAPQILTSERTTPSEALDIFGYRSPAKFTAPDIRFSAPQPLLVTGGLFIVVSEQEGIVPDSTYLFGEYRWADLLRSGDLVIPAGDRPMLVAANCAWGSFYHWIFQGLAAALLARETGIERDLQIIAPPLDALRRSSLELAGFLPDQWVELSAGQIMLPEQGFWTNLTSGGFAFTPHPAIVRSFAPLAARAARSRFAGRKIFISRSDSQNRPMTNEAALADRLAARGFDTVVMSALPLSEQIALFRDAALIIAQHGAALTNLVFAGDGDEGPIVIELHQDNYVHSAFLKIAQVKGLRYTAVISPMTDAGHAPPHSARWTADIDLVLRAVDAH